LKDVVKPGAQFVHVQQTKDFAHGSSLIYSLVPGFSPTVGRRTPGPPLPKLGEGSGVRGSIEEEQAVEAKFRKRNKGQEQIRGNPHKRVAPESFCRPREPRLAPAAAFLQTTAGA
jgi:hypothetical protein